MASERLAADFLTLRKALANIRSIITSFTSALSSPSNPQKTSEESPDPFSVIADAAKLLKAQITKLSLLLINNPFSPKEVTFILNALTTSILPALMSALELCPAERYTRTLHIHLQASLRRLWKDLLDVLSNIPEDETQLAIDRKTTTLSSTGVLWEQCDALIELGEKGPIQFLDKRLKEYQGLFEDAITELEGWDPDDDDEEEEDSDFDSGENIAGSRAPKDTVNTPTTSDEERLGEGIAHLSISPLVSLKTKVLKRLRLIRLLYPALRKRRMATFPAKGTSEAWQFTGPVYKIDILIESAKLFTEHADELAGFLYSEAVNEAEGMLAKLSNEAGTCSDLFKLDWASKEDEFSKWAIKWKDRFEELRSEVC